MKYEMHMHPIVRSNDRAWGFSYTCRFISKKNRKR